MNGSEPKDLMPDFITEITADLSDFKDRVFALHGQDESSLGIEIPGLVEIWYLFWLKIGDFNRLCESLEEKSTLDRSEVGGWYFHQFLPLLKELYPQIGTPIRNQMKDALWLWTQEEWLYHSANCWMAEYQAS